MKFTARDADRLKEVQESLRRMKAEREKGAPKSDDQLALEVERDELKAKKSKSQALDKKRTLADKRRKQRTHELCQLGGLVEKAELPKDWKPRRLLGLLIAAKAEAEKNPSTLEKWDALGDKKFSEDDAKKER